MSFHSSPKAKENLESWERIFRQTLSKERLFTSTRAAENPIHWIHLLDPFDQHYTRKVCKISATHSDLAGNEGLLKSGHLSADKSLQSNLPEAVAALAQAAVKVSGESRFGGSIDLPGWPLIPFSKVQTIKCEKCCLEFCSPINHRRHLRTIHRRTSNAEKEDVQSQRQQFATFWDKLSPEEAYKIAAVKNLQIEDLTGDKVVRALSHVLQQPGVFALPHSYVKSGAMLLELVQSRLSRIFLTSSELFQILDGSSEKTFPSFGLSAMQKYVFEGGAGKVGLETKNLVATLSFLVEHNLVKAFIKDKDEEAMRCQTALVEEEEASQRKQAQIQARKDMKKVRQKDKEQKAVAVAICLPDINPSDDETSSRRCSADSPTRPPSNTFENLNHQLAGGLDFEDIISRGVSSPSGKSLAPVDPNDEVVSAPVSSPCRKSLVIVGSRDEVVSSAMVSPVENGLHVVESSDVARIADDVGLVSSALDVETKDSSNFPETDKSGLSDAPDIRRPYNFQKHELHAERSLSAGGDAVFFPNQKQTWKERRSLSAKDICKETSANEDEEDIGLSSSYFPGATTRNPSAAKVVGSRPRQYVAKPLRLRNSQAAARLGASVWTKKVGKFADTVAAKIPHSTKSAVSISPEVSDADTVLNTNSSAGVLSTAAPHDQQPGCAFVSNISGCSNADPSLRAVFSDKNHCKTSSSSHEDARAGLRMADSGHCNQVGASSAPVVIGSVVISSFDDSLESMVGNKDSNLTPSPWKQLPEASKIVENVSKSELAELVDPIESSKENMEALAHDGKNKYGSHRGGKGEEKSLNILLQSGSERNENKDHSMSQAGVGSLMKLSVPQGGVVAGRKMKIWQPVVSNPHRDSCIDEIPTLDVSTPDLGSKASLDHSLITSEDISNIDPKELERDQAFEEDSDILYPSISARAKTVAEGGTVLEADGKSTLKAVASFLLKRWSDAMSSSDSVILSVEDEESGARELDVSFVDVQRRDYDVDSMNSPNPAPHLNKGANNCPGNATKAYGLWKQGCSGSAMAVNRQMMGKENSHFASRYASYRYVPK